jgi:hypothetical protein
MGLTMDQVNAGAADAFKIINQSMDTWDRIQATINPPKPPPLAQTTTQPAVADRAVQSAPAAVGDLLAGIPAWALLAGVGLLLWRFA